ncbi:MAG: DNA-processing protein DprA [Chloroflexota bacterium]
MARVPNDETVLLACSGLAKARGGDARPLGPKAWASLRERIRDAELEPGELVPMSANELEQRLDIAPDRAERLAGLFARHGQLAFELERLGRLGIWITTVESDDYPERLRERLGPGTPPVLFGLGDRALLDRQGLAVVGSRDVDAGSLEVARTAGAEAARQGWAIVSGAARGVDAASMRGAFDAGGAVVGVTADGLERHLRDASLRSAFVDGRAVYVSPYRPDAPFSVGGAMGRNKLIYCLSSAALIVHSSSGSGGTWSGAIEALDAGWVPVHVNDADGEVPGNEALISRGGRRRRPEQLTDLEALAAFSVEEVPDRAGDEPDTTQQTLF